MPESRVAFGGQPGGGPGQLSAASPRRVLTISADMGGGHDATAAAVEEAVGRVWPGSETCRVDTLDVMGRGVGRWFRAIYVANVEATPWLYELFYASLWRHRWFAETSKRFTGSWSGRRLVAELDRFDPDLIVSTYPLGSAGIAWLRRHRGLQTPALAYVSDLAPHPFWVYPEMDVTFVMHEAAVPLARAADARATIEVCAPPVVRSFAPGAQSPAREGTQLREDAFVVLVSCGAYAFGDVAETVQALLGASTQVQVVAACGRNQQTRTGLERLGEPHARLVPLGWTDDMPGYVRAADLVLSNAGGATALEALATGRPLVMSQPIAAHGLANAELAVVAGLADLCATTEELVAYVRAAIADQTMLTDLERRATAHAAGHTLDDWLARSAPVLQPSPPVRGPARPRPDLPWRMRAQDAFFAQVDSEGLRQQVCLVLELEDVAPGRSLDVEELRQVVAPRVLGLAPLRRRWVAGPPLGWLCAPVNIADHVIECRVDARETVEDRVDRFLSETLPGDRPGWQMLLVHSAAETRTVLAVQLHHVYGDGISALSLLDRLLTPAPGDPLRERRAAARPRRQAWGPRPALHLAGRVSRGLASLAAHGTAPTHPLTARPTGPGRRLVTVRLPLSRLRQMAGRHDARGHEVMLTVLADALGRTLGSAGLLQPGSPLRVMVPVAMRLPRLDRIFGNWTGSVALDLPLDPMPFGQRLAMVRSESRHRSGRGEPLAAEVVLRVAGRLPGPLPRWFARAVYSRRFFNSIVSYMPMTRGPRWCAGAKVRAMYPVLPLTRGVPLTVGVILTDDTVCLGVLLDDTLPLTRAGLAEAVQGAWAAAVVESG